MLAGSCIVAFLSAINYATAAWTDGLYEGTKWCGTGNIAKDDNDLGKFDKLDACCRDHDRCSVNLDPAESGYGLTNLWFHTRSSCDCDNVYFKCMKNISGGQKTHADIIGIMYFQILHPACMQLYHPKKCKNRVLGICINWKTDKSKVEWKWVSGKYWLDFMNVITIF